MCRRGGLSGRLVGGEVGMNDLIDTTEMYLRTVYELMEEGIPPLRARIAERLHQSGPTVSQTVARMERDGLLTVHEDRHIELSPKGFELAVAVMRKHRLAEQLLTDVIGLDWSLVHDEACRWEHVISEDVERRLVTILGDPTVSPYGTPVPGLSELGAPPAGIAFRTGADPLPDVVDAGASRVHLVRLSEHAQADEGILPRLDALGARPGVELEVSAVPGGIRIAHDDQVWLCPLDVAEGLFVAPVAG